MGIGLVMLVAFSALLAFWDLQRARFAAPSGGLAPQAQPRNSGFF